MMTLTSIFFLFMFILCCFSVLKFFKEFLMVLLSLEFSTLSLFFFFFFFLSFFNYEMYYCMFFLVFSVCEGVLGLSLLVKCIRYYSSDNYPVFSLIF